MMTRKPLSARAALPFLCLLALVLGLCLSPAHGDTGPGDWCMFHHDPQHSGRSPFTGPASPVEKWAFATGGEVDSSVALGADGTIYVGSDKLYAITPDGTQKWAFPTGGGIWSSPAIGANGTIYIGSDDHNLYAINPDGTQMWVFPTADIIESSPALGADGTIYIESVDGTLYAVNPNGTQQWAFSIGASTYSSPALGVDGAI